MAMTEERKSIKMTECNTYTSLIQGHKIIPLFRVLLTLVKLNKDATPNSNFQPIRLLDPGCLYLFTYLMASRADPDKLTSSEAN